jgi:hypothetical protein
MLNTKYIIYTDREGKQNVQYNPDANGAAWFVSGVLIADGPFEEIEGLGQIDTKTEAVVEKRFAAPLDGMDFAAGDTTDYIRLTDYRSNYLRYDAESSRERVAVFSEIYYDKGWTAYIDGKEAPYFRADYILRAMRVPAGNHTIEWKFRAPAFDKVESATLGSSIAILVWVLIATVINLRRRKK